MLVVADVQLDDVPAHLRGDAHEVRAHRRVIRLGPPLPLEQRDDHGDGGGGDDARPEQSANDATGAGAS